MAADTSRSHLDLLATSRYLAIINERIQVRETWIMDLHQKIGEYEDEIDQLKRLHAAVAKRLHVVVAEKGDEG